MSASLLLNVHGPVHWAEWYAKAIISHLDWPCSYEARASGVKRNMRGDQARAACPDIQLVQASGPWGCRSFRCHSRPAAVGGRQGSIHPSHHSCKPACLPDQK
jgi:nucleotidyltransferase/DNA polymerase involved in DNA repair